MKRNQIVAWTLVGVLGIVSAMLALEVLVKESPAQTHRAARPISEAPKVELPMPPLPKPRAESADGWKPSEELKEPVVEMPSQPASHQSVLRRLDAAIEKHEQQQLAIQAGLAANENPRLSNRTARKINEQLDTVLTDDTVADMERRERELAKLIKMRNSNEISGDVCAERAVEILNGQRLTAGEPTK